MKVAVLSRSNEPFSIASYRDNVIHELLLLGVTVIPFGEAERIPAECDLVWEPAISGNRRPFGNLKYCNKPLVLTIHGAAPYTVKWNEYFSDPFEAVKVRRINRAALHEWSSVREKLSAVIAVSKFGADEVARVYGLPREMITCIYHGVDKGVFSVESPSFPLNKEPYFLHASQYQPLKNLGRLFEAHACLPLSKRPRLIAVIPGYSRFHPLPSYDDVEIIDRGLAPRELAILFRHALGFVFPSIRETFGMPIIEAMSCGCPVITSYDTACAEVAGDAALLVNPRSVPELAAAMGRIASDEELRRRLREKGLARAAGFSWQESAKRHLQVFTNVLQAGKTA